MMMRSELIDVVKSGRTVTLMLTDAEVISVKEAMFLPMHYNPRYRATYGTRYLKVVVKDPELGVLFFKSYSDKLADLCKGDKVSLKITVTGVGDATERYPDPILFAKTHTRKGDSVAIAKPIVAEPDLTVNV